MVLGVALPCDDEEEGGAFLLGGCFFLLLFLLLLLRLLLRLLVFVFFLVKSACSWSSLGERRRPLLARELVRVGGSEGALGGFGLAVVVVVVAVGGDRDRGCGGFGVCVCVDVNAGVSHGKVAKGLVASWISFWNMVVTFPRGWSRRCFLDSGIWFEMMHVGRFGLFIFRFFLCGLEARYLGRLGGLCFLAWFC